MLTAVVAEILRRQSPAPGRRLLVGVAGAPGAGKSTLAAELAAALQQQHRAVVVPMDGYHLTNAELDRLGRAGRKGAPDTFDQAGYAALLRRLHLPHSEIVYAPAFDHVRNEPTAGAIPVPPSARIVITEGNYLLVWPPVRQLLDLSVHVEAEHTGRVAGLVDRQRAKGLDDRAAREWVYRSDEANAELVTAYARFADLRLTRG